MDPLVAMMAAADATSRLRILSLVLANDYRHPALVHKAISTIDVLSGGRVELGLGAGWLASDYDALGLPFDRPATRVERLGESVRLIKRLFAAEAPVSVEGTHYRIREYESIPRPVQRPRPPLLVGGGSRGVLSLAGREADIVGVNASLRPGAGRASGIAGMTARDVEQKVAWVRAAAREAGRAPAEVELQVSILEVHVTTSRAETDRVLDSLGDGLGLPRQVLDTSPAILVGDVERCCELLEQLRERFGFSYVKLGSDPAAVAPLVARLAGR
jgi:probable F420-dependent oxidoreductase